MSFVRVAAEDLSTIADAVVTTRSVLIYVDDKAAAFRAFHRVLKAGGRLSIFEPITTTCPTRRTSSGGSMLGPFVTSSSRSGSRGVGGILVCE